ncbi:MAG: TrkA C-terminal domain-containing protein, partial [Desulfosudaceae bacterium]
YGVAYPFGLLGVILFISIAMRILRKRLEEETRSYTSMVAKLYRVINDKYHGQLIKEISDIQDSNVAISGILRDLSLRAASGSTALFKNDIVRLEGTQEDVEKVGTILGEEVLENFEDSPELDSRSIVVENKSVINRSLTDLGIRLRFNVSLTRIIRANLEFIPRYDQVLEHGDVMVAVGSPYQLDQLEMFLGHEHQAVQRRVDLRSLAAALFLAFFIGGLIIPFPAIGNFSLGLAGGGLIAGLIFGHFGQIGNFIGRFPRNATEVLKELGLALFFVQVGFETGQTFVEFLDFDVIYYALYAVLFVTIPMTASFLTGHYLMKIPISECFGVICGGMTFTPGLDIIREADKSERPVVAYSSVYPVSLILVILLVQGMYLTLTLLGG